MISPVEGLDHPPAPLIECSLLHGSDETFSIYGGSLAASNGSANRPMVTSPVPSTQWTWSSQNVSWSSATLHGVDLNYAPMHTMFAQAPDQNLVFILNGIVSSPGVSSERVFPSMIVINTQTNSARVVSTESISPSTSRVEGILQYLPLLGKKGALVLLGGATKYNDNITTDDWGTMVLHPLLTQTRH
jgi:hypothetical protein